MAAGLQTTNDLPTDGQGQYFLGLFETTGSTFKLLKGVSVDGDVAAMAVSLDGEEVVIDDPCAGTQTNDIKITLDGESVDINDISKGTQTNDVKITLDSEEITLADNSSTYVGILKSDVQSVASLDSEEITDTNEAVGEILDTNGASRITAYVSNSLDQDITINMEAGPDDALSTVAVDLGSFVVAAGDTGYYHVNEYHPYVRLTGQCSVAPTSGSVLGYLVSSTH